jgi:hypothetical protein
VSNALRWQLKHGSTDGLFVKRRAQDISFSNIASASWLHKYSRRTVAA